TRYSETGARGRRSDARWRADSPTRASPDRHNRCADKSAWRCQPHGGAGSSVPWGRAVAEAALWDARCLAHTGHSEAFSSGPLKGFGALDRLLLGLMGVAVGGIGAPR